TISRDLYTQLTAEARAHGDLGIPNYLTWLLSGSPGKIGGSTVLRTEEVQNRPKSHKRNVAGRVGFEPTICGSAGRRLGPGSTTGPEKSDRFLSFLRYHIDPVRNPVG